jgi:hypothetical protein
MKNREALLRVFISYSHKDKLLVIKLAEILKNNGMLPMWSEKLFIGSGFDELIKNFIEHAHIFMPVLTESSSGWVHQEIGYAQALNIPVFPVTTDNIIPKGMLQMIQALKLSNDEIILSKDLNINVFRRLLESKSPIAMYQRAGMVEERACMMKDYADKLINMNEFGLVRQKGGLSSFHIPAEPINNPKWIDRYYPEKRSDYHKKVQREERIALQRHADEAGCRLIINPAYAYMIKGRSALAAKSRLLEFVDFLESMSSDKVVVAIMPVQTDNESLTIVGDWFLSESVSFKDGDGFTNTFFTRNASEIAKRIEEFDNELNRLLIESGYTVSESKRRVISELTRIIETLDH